MTHNNGAAAEFDIIIVGAGMVGASLACALADTGLRLAVLDSQVIGGHERDPAAFDPRVSAITPASRDFFKSLQVWDAIAERRCAPYRNMHVWEADGTGSIHFSAADIHAEALGYIVENPVILAALHARLALQENATLFAPVTLAQMTPPLPAANGLPGAVTLILGDDRSLTTRLVVAADGANSRVRDLAGFKTREWDYEHHAIVTTVRTELPHQQTAIQRFMDEGVLAFLPLCQHGGEAPDDQHYSSIVWSVLPDYARYLMALEDDEFNRVLEGAIENRLGTVAHVEVRHSFPLRQRHATSYVRDGIALIGDAAHTIHPLAGQGVNLGLLDASVLAMQLRQAWSSGRDFADLRTLRRYQRRRIGHNLGMMWMMEGFKYLFADQPLPLRWLRNAGMTGLDGAAPIKNRIMRMAMGMD